MSDRTWSDGRVPADRRTVARTLRRCVRPWSCFGGLALVGLVVQLASGLSMVFTYQPTPDRAYASVYYIVNARPYGWLAYAVHVWGALAVTVLLLLHAARRFSTAGYKPRGRAAWVVGALALLAVIALAFTGSLLPWDQKAYWGTTAGVSLLRELPVLGDTIAGAAVGGDTLGAPALTRFFGAHVAVLPATLAVLVLVHMRGALRDPGTADEDGPPLADVMLSAATTMVLLLCVYAVLATLVPVPLGVRADPSTASTPGPPWFLLPVDALAHLVPPPLAVASAAAVATLFALVPYVDRTPSRAPRDRLAVLAGGAVIAACVAALSLLGATR